MSAISQPFIYLFILVRLAVQVKTLHFDEVKTFHFRLRCLLELMNKESHYGGAMKLKINCVRIVNE